MLEDKLRIRAGKRTDTGKVRERNEDDYCIRFAEEDGSDQLWLLAAVADGMGGGPAGDMASGVAMQVLEERFGAMDKATDQPADILKTAFYEANRIIYQATQEDKRYAGMGTTLTAVLIKDNVATIGHVGDDRAYLIRDGKMTQITEDHSLVAEQIKRGEITPEEARTSPQRNIITRSVGTKPRVAAEIYEQEIKRGDGLLLCTDGLTDLVKDEEVLTIVMDTKSIQQACDDLVELANQRGGHDNVTVVALEFGELSRERVDQQPAPEPPPKQRRRPRKLLKVIVFIVFLALLALGIYIFKANFLK